MSRIRPREEDHDPAVQDAMDLVCGLTGCSPARALACLKSANFNADAAVGIYFDTKHMFAADEAVIDVDTMDMQGMPAAQEPPRRPMLAAAAPPRGQQPPIPRPRPGMPPANDAAQGPAIGGALAAHAAPAAAVGHDPLRDFSRRHSTGTVNVDKTLFESLMVPFATDPPVNRPGIPWKLVSRAVEALPCLGPVDAVEPLSFWTQLQQADNYAQAHGVSPPGTVVPMTLLAAHLFLECNAIDQDRFLSPLVFEAVVLIRRLRKELILSPDGTRRLALVDGHAIAMRPRCQCQHGDLHRLLFAMANSQSLNMVLHAKIVDLASKQVELSVFICAETHVEECIQASHKTLECRLPVQPVCIVEEKRAMASLSAYLQLRLAAPEASPQQPRPLLDVERVIREPLPLVPTTVVPATHPKLALTLRPYQVDSVSKMVDVENHRLEVYGVHKLKCGGMLMAKHDTGKYVLLSRYSEFARGGILADEMGLGKTLSCIAAAVFNPPTPSNMPSADCLRGRTFIPATFIFGTVSIVGQWEQEIQKSFPTAKVLRFYGSKRNSFSIADLVECDFIVSTTHTGFGDLCRYKVLGKCWFHRIIVDEFHAAPTSPDFPCSFLWLVSGTPSTAMACDMFFFWYVKRCLAASGMSSEYYGSRSPFVSGTPARVVVPGAGYTLAGRTRRAAAVDPVVLDGGLPTIQHRKADIPEDQLQLPPRQFVTARFPLSPSEQVLYRHAYLPIVANLRQMKRHAVIENHGTVRNWLTAMRQLAVDPSATVATQAPAQHFDVARANDRADVREMTTAEVRDSHPAECHYPMNEQLDEFLRGLDGNPPDPGQCILCLDVMRMPLLLRCTHVFCQECVQNTINMNATGNMCPVCRAPTLNQPKFTVVAQVRAAPPQAADEDAPRDDGAAARPQEDAAPTAAAVAAAKRQVADELPSRIAAALQVIKDAMAAEAGNPRPPKFVVFSSMQSFLRRMETELQRRQIDSVTIDGSVPMTERAKNTTAFQDPRSTVRVCLLSSRAAAAGLTLTAANHMILVEPATNNSIEAQAMGRIHRLGQDRPVTMHRLAAAATIDDRIYALLDAGHITTTGLERFDQVENRTDVCRLMLRILVSDAFAAQIFA